MPYVNPIQMTPNIDPFGAMERGLGMRDILRKRSFDKALNDAASRFDLTTPQGQVGAMQMLSQQGYGREIMDVQKQYYDPDSREKQKQYQRDDSFRGWMGQNSPYGPKDPMADLELDEEPTGRFPGQQAPQGRFQGEQRPMPGQPQGPAQGVTQAPGQGFTSPMPPALGAAVERAQEGIPEVSPDAPRALPSQGVGGSDSSRLMNEAATRFLAGRQQEAAPTQSGAIGDLDDRMAWAAVQRDKMTVSEYLQNKRLREASGKTDKPKDIDPFDDPVKYQTYLQVAQSDPEFQAINRELATNRAKAGPKLTQWAIKHGYAGQKWWDREFGNLTKEAEKGPDRGAVSAAQNVHTNIRNARKDFEDNDFVKMIPKTDRYFQSAQKSWEDYQNAPAAEKGSKRQFMDQALVYSFNKLMEETSAVMPGEFERTALGQSVPDAVINKIRSGLGGGLKLDDGQRQAMLNTMKIFRDGVLENARPVYGQFENEARLLSPDDPDRILGGYKKYFTNQSPGATKPKAVKPYKVAGKMVERVTPADIDRMTAEEFAIWEKDNP